MAALETEERATVVGGAGGGARRTVVVHAGARDAYQMAAALEERGMLDALVTDLFWPQDRAWARELARLLPRGARAMLQQRSAALPFARVRLRWFSGLRTLLLEKLPRTPFALRRWSQRRGDALLGAAAGRLANTHDAGLVAYSYYGFAAMSRYRKPAMLFQLHPHPATMRRILQRELEEHPDCAASLCQEWELALPEEEYARLVAETRMAARFLVASSFTRDSLIEHGAAAEAITVVPYGVDLERFRPGVGAERARGGSLRLLFVGRINQRKGIKYLLEALRGFAADEVQLTVCGRVVDDLALFRGMEAQVTIRPSVSGEELVAAYQAADLFVFPSVAEGFGQVLLEALACGLPLLSTTHTAAPDLIQEGREGFIVEPRRADRLAERIAWARDHRVELAEMRQSARTCAERFTWERFRAESAAAVSTYLVSLGEDGTAGESAR